MNAGPAKKGSGIFITTHHQAHDSSLHWAQVLTLLGTAKSLSLSMKTCTTCRAAALLMGAAFLQPCLVHREAQPDSSSAAMAWRDVRQMQNKDCKEMKHYFVAEKAPANKGHQLQRRQADMLCCIFMQVQQRWLLQASEV